MVAKTGERLVHKMRRDYAERQRVRGIKQFWLGFMICIGIPIVDIVLLLNIEMIMPASQRNSSIDFCYLLYTAGVLYCRAFVVVTPIVIYLLLRFFRVRSAVVIVCILIVYILTSLANFFLVETIRYV